MSKKTPPLPPHVASLQPYESARSLLKGEEWIFLDANESPFAGAVQPPDTARFNRYPDPTADALRDAIANHYGVKRANVIAGNGSDELIDLSVRAFVRRNRSVLSFKPTYGMYNVVANMNGVTYRSRDLREDFSLDENALLLGADADLLFLCNPNNPTGIVIDQSVIENILDAFPGLVVVDEAYGEFADAEGIPSSIELLRKGAKNLLVLRTFSKAFGAAGIRLGYGIAGEEIIEILLRMKPPYNVNILTQTIGLELWNKRSVMEENIRILVSERTKLMQACAALGWTIFPSSANFFLLKPPPSISAEQAYRSLMENSRLVLRRFAGSMMENILRVSIGTPDQNDLLLSTLSSLPSR